jgi:hypothetical protein
MPRGDAQPVDVRYILSAMNRLIALLLSASSVALLLAACDAGGSWGNWGYGAGNGGATSTCSANKSCETCTPVSGCGWCTAPNGSGVCSPNPDDCPTEQFSWTWDPSGCRVIADASIVPSDASQADAGVAPRESGAAQEAAIDGSGESGCTRSVDASDDGASHCD